MSLETRDRFDKGLFELRDQKLVTYCQGMDVWDRALEASSSSANSAVLFMYITYEVVYMRR